MNAAQHTEPRLTQVMDWSAAVWAGILAGLAFLGFLAVVAPQLGLFNEWVYLRLIASVPLGQEVLAPPATFDAKVLGAAVITQLLLSVSFSIVIAFIFHRWGLFIGILGGALAGAALYVINFWALSYFFPWFYAMRGVDMLIGHILFGAVAGGIYEALEADEFEVDDDGEILSA